jgi:hypothetical protein
MAQDDGTKDKSPVFNHEEALANWRRRMAEDTARDATLPNRQSVATGTGPQFFHVPTYL